MNKIKMKLLTHKVLLVAIGVLAIGGYAYASNLIQNIENYYEATPSTSPTTETDPTELGSMVGPDLYIPYLSINGFTRVYDSQRARKGTSTVCALKSPSMASSTLSWANYTFDNVATSTAVIVTMAKATTAFATTTAISSDTIIAAGLPRTHMASSTDEQPANLLFNPDEYFVVSIKGVTAGQLQSEETDGWCQAEWTLVDTD